VARLVAEGLTNRQAAARLFVSPRTISAHLRHIFGKLQIGSRVELVRTVAAGVPTVAGPDPGDLAAATHPFGIVNARDVVRAEPPTIGLPGDGDPGPWRRS